MSGNMGFRKENTMEKTFDWVELDTMSSRLERATGLTQYLLTQDDFFTQDRASEGFTKRFVRTALYDLELLAKELSAQ
jgi:adenine deaminase